MFLEARMNYSFPYTSPVDAFLHSGLWIRNLYFWALFPFDLEYKIKDAVPEINIWYP